MVNKSIKQRFLFVFIDILILCLSFFISCNLNFHVISSERHLFFLIILGLVWLIVGSIFNVFFYDRAARIEKILSNLLKALLVNALSITAIIFVINSNTFSTNYVLKILGIVSSSIILCRFLSILLIKNYRKRGYNYKNIIIVSSGNISKQLYGFFMKKEHGYNLLATFNSNSNKQFNNLNNYHLDYLEEFCNNNIVEEIFFSNSIYDVDSIKNMMQFCDDKMIRLRIVPELSAFKQRKIKFESLGGIPIINLREEPLQYEINRLVKRTFDIIFSLIIILFVMSWLVPLIGVLIKLESKGPIFFTQKRSGLDNKEFKCYKFRSMIVNEKSDTQQASKNDSRMTILGRFLRRSSIDEMPQFFNVFIGDMSVVGPRPHMLKHTVDYSKIIDGYMLRHLVMPGITGAAQVNGFRGETKTKEDMENRVKYDVWYLENWTLFLDIKLIFLTALNLIKGSENAV